ncbi:hypothetical protein EVAR_58522_1 [Eumeta japonica]|uniref:Serine/threonine-protein phosphatase 2A regulatory subunit B'' subunit gamma n=1 Tax=Eumeta variegata TaxID=151549 RepID=A0A4C1YSQ7_EUMVA|nr:hypothetical protein EVAR_58522_1 [Eumeta japonica]
MSSDNKDTDKSIDESQKIKEDNTKINAELKNRLRKYIKKLDDSKTSLSKEECEKIEKETFKQLYQPRLEGDENSYKKIPKFYFKLPRSDEQLAQKLREETRAQFLQKKSKELLDNGELKYLWSLLEKTNNYNMTNNDEVIIEYEDYRKIREEAGAKYKPRVCRAEEEETLHHFEEDPMISTNAVANQLCMSQSKVWFTVSTARLYLYHYTPVHVLEGDSVRKPYLTWEVFARLQAAEGGVGRIRAVSLFNYVMRRVWLQQTRIGLSLYDVTGQGYLREHDLESYIGELVPSLAALDGLDSSFSSFYVCTAARKFLFFLDPLRVGRVRIRDVLSCSFLDDLLELREEDLPMELQEQNWFSAPSALRVYGQYLNLDRDHNGMLSIDELAGYGSGTLTRAFLQRVFQQCLTYDGEMDYKTYLDFVLALENRKEPAAIAYLFRVLDINSQGYLDAFTLNYFFKAIQEQMVTHGAEPVNFEDVKDEIFDMVRPEDPSKITLQDLIRSGHGHTAISILLELHGFWAYENREALAAAGDSPQKNG